MCLQQEIQESNNKPFPDDLILKFLDLNDPKITKGSPKHFELFEDFRFHSKNDYFKDNPIIVSKGFPTDFASVPPVFRSFIPRVGVYGKAAVIHDYLCEKVPIPRKEADKIFLEAMEVLEVPRFTRKIMYRAVRAWSTVSFLKHLLSNHSKSEDSCST